MKRVMERGYSASLCVLLSGVVGGLLPLSLSAQEGVETLRSDFPAAETQQRLVEGLRQAGMTVFNEIDHADNAASVGLSLRETRLIIFGNPALGTQLMQCQQSIALDLPQKALVTEDESGDVWLSWNQPAYLADRHGLGGDCAELIEKVTGALDSIMSSAAGQ